MAGKDRTFRVFVSSTFSDFVAERNVLQRHAFRNLGEYCRARGARFQPIDLRWGIRDEAGLDHSTMRLCIDELRRCQQTTPRPNFIVLLGDRYGWRPLPSHIQALEFDGLFADMSDAEKQRLRSWYWRDDNAVPPDYVLQPRSGEFCDPKRWQEEEAALRRILVCGVNRTLAPSDPLRSKYFDSATHQEIRYGALETEHPESHVFCYFREFERRLAPEDSGAEHFIDLMANFESLDQRSIDAEAQAHLHKLKENLSVRCGPAHVYRYPISRFDRLISEAQDHVTRKQLLKLSDRVERDLRKIIEQELVTFDEATMQVDPESMAQEEFADRRRADFVGREHLLSQIASYLVSQSRRPFVVYGPSGCGKTALMAEAAHRTKSVGISDVEPLVLFRAIGATANSSDIGSLLESLCCQIDRDRGMSPSQAGVGAYDVMEAFRSRLATATPGRPLIIFLDSLDQLGSSDKAHHLAWVPRELPPYVKLVLSLLEVKERPDDCRYMAEMIGGEDHLMRVGGLTPTEGETLLNAWLKGGGRRLGAGETSPLAADQKAERHGRRRLTSFQRNEVLRNFNDSGERSPLYLRLAFEEARRWESYAQPDATVLAGTTSALISRFLDRLCSSQNHTQMLVDRALGYLAASRHGLTEDELIDVLSADDEFLQKFQHHAHHSLPEKRLPIVAWARLHADITFYLAERLADRTNVLSFYHRQLSSVIAERLLCGEHGRWLHRRLADYFGGRLSTPSQPNEFVASDGTRIPNYRKLSELPYQLRHAHMHDELERTLTDLSFLDTKCRAGMLFDALSDCRLSSTQGELSAVGMMQQALSLAMPSLLLHPEIGGQQVFNRLQWLEPRDPIVANDFAGMSAYLDSRGYWIQADARLPEPFTEERGLVLPLRSPSHLQAVSPNGRLFAVLYDDKELEIWDLKGCERLDRRRVRAHRPVAIAVGEEIRSFALMEYGGQVQCPWLGGASIARACEAEVLFHSTHGVIMVQPDRTLVAWNPLCDEIAPVAGDVPAPLCVLRIAPDGRHLLHIAGERQQEIGISSWSSSRWKTSRFPYVGPSIIDASIDGEGTLILLACRDRHLRILDAASGVFRLPTLAYEAHPHVPIRGAPARCELGFGSSSGKAFLATNDGHVACWNWREGSLERWEDFRSISETASLVLFKVLPPEGRLLVSTARAGGTPSAMEERPPSIRDGNSAEVSSVLLTRKDEIVSACRLDRTLRWFSARGLRLLGIRAFTSMPIVCLAGLPDSDSVLVGSDQGEVAIVERHEVGFLRRILGNLADPIASLFTSSGCAVAATRAGKIVAFSLLNPEVHVVRLATGFLIQKKVLAAGEHGLCWSIHRDIHSPNEVCIVTLVQQSGQEEVIFSTSGDVRDAAVTRDGSTFCLAGNQVNLLRRSGTKWKPASKRSELAKCITFLLGDRFLAAASSNAPWLEVWDVERELSTVAAIDLPSHASCIASQDDRIVVGLQSGALLSLQFRGTQLATTDIDEGPLL